MPKKSYTADEVSELTGLDREQVDALIDSERLRGVDRGKGLRIPEAELRRVGLLPDSRRAAGDGDDDESSVIQRLTDRIERQAAELGGLRLLTVQAESLHEREVDRLREALHEAQARVREVEARAAEREEELTRAHADVQAELRVAQARIEELRSRLEDDRRWIAPRRGWLRGR